MAFNLDKVRQEFPILQRQVHGRPLTYLDSAATALKPQVVVDTIADHYRNGTSNVHRGVHFLSEQATLRYEEARRKIAKFINAERPEDVVFTSGTTHSINLIAQTFGRLQLSVGDEILVSYMEHHSNIVPWQLLAEQMGAKLRAVPITDAGELDWEAFLSAFTDRVKLVSMVHVSNSLGTINPAKQIVKEAHQRGIPVILDGAQAMAHLAVDVQDLDCDFYAFSGHKFCAGTGTGGFFAKRRHLETMPPFFGGGDMIRSVTFEKSTFAPPPMKFEAGTPNISGVLSMGAAVDYLSALDRTAMEEHELDLLRYGTASLVEIPGVRLIGTAQEKVPVLSFVVDEIHPHDLGTLLDREGVAIRTGHHCTQPVMQRFKVPATARASLAFYNSRADIDALCRALIKAKEVFR